MPDPSSGIISKQEKNILNEIEESKSNPSHDFIAATRNRSQLYELGLEIIHNAGYKLQLSEKGTFCYHDIYKATSLGEDTVKGINYPNSFQPYIRVTDINDVFELFDYFCEEANDDQLIEFWTPLWIKPPNTTPFELFSQSKLSLDKQAFISNIKKENVLELYHSFYYNVNTNEDDFFKHPLVWVPARAWFNDKVKQLRFEDIFTIFPSAELELFKLILGRVGVGINGHQPPGTNIVVNHTFRMAGILIGREAGLGKSTMMEAFISALSHCGFTTATFRDITTQFGLKEGALSHVLYKDDTTIKTLSKILTSEETKILVSNGLMQSEEKFQSKEEVKSRCVLIASSNDWDPNLVYNLDSGIISRIKLLSTYYYNEMQRKDHYIPTIGKSTADLRPHYHLKWLANELNVDKEAIMLWGLRLATDRFYEVITKDVKPGINALEVEVRKWTSRCRIRFKADSTQALINAIVISLIIKNTNKQWELPELSAETLAEGLSSFYYIISDLAGTKLISMMKQDWLDNDRIPTHYYEGFREVLPESLKIAGDTYNRYMQEPPSNKTAINDMVKNIMGKITLRDGFKISPGMSYLIEFWKRSQFNLEDLKESASEVLMSFEEHCPKEFACLMDHFADGPCDSWMSDLNYSPKNAERLKTDYLKHDQRYLKRLKKYD